MKSTELQPTEDKVLVKPQELETGEATTESGIVFDLDQNNSIIDRPTQGTVVACGIFTKEIQPEMEVQWIETDGQDIMLEDGHFIMLKESSILGYKTCKI